MNENVTIRLNDTQRCFIVERAGTVSCLGYDNCFYDAWMLATKLNRPDLRPIDWEIGAISQYNQHQELLNLANGKDLGTWYDFKTPMMVKVALEMARNRKKRVRIWYGDTTTGESWLDEHEVVGYVGRSTGIKKVPLLIANSAASGGGAILDSRIIRIVQIEGKLELYRHSRFFVPDMTVGMTKDVLLPADVMVNGSKHASFKSREKAENWIAFMRGDRFRP